MKLKIEQVQLLLNCLTQLDGYDQVGKVVAKDGTVTEKIIRKPYSLSGKTRLRIADNISLLEDRMKNFHKVRNDIITQISEGENVIKKDDNERLAKYKSEILSILEDEVDIPALTPLSARGLGLDSDDEANALPIEVIKCLRELKFIE